MPFRFVGETLAGEEIKVAVTGESPAALTDAVTALDDCWTVRAFDKDGNLIRKLELDPHDPELATDLEDQEQKPRPGAIISIDVPKLVDNIARNMREVAASSASQQANAFKEGFAAMTSVVNLCLEMLLRVDRRLEQAEDRVVEPPAHDDRQSLAMMALQRALGGAPAGQTPPPGSNGGGHISPEIIQSLLSQLGGTQGDETDGTG